MNKKVTDIAKLLGLPECIIDAVLYSYTSEVIQECMIKKETDCIFGKIFIDDDYNIRLESSVGDLKNGILNKDNLNLIMELVRHDTKLSNIS